MSASNPVASAKRCDRKVRQDVRRRRSGHSGRTQTVVKSFRAALWIIRDVTLPSLRQHRLRALLTLVGVVIGTQVVVAIALMNRSIVASFEHTVETIAGRANLQVSNGSAGVPEELVGSIETVSGVASATGLLQGTLMTEWGDLTVFGVDLFDDQTIRETQFPRRNVHIGDPLRFANATDSIAVSSTFLARAGLAVGDTFEAQGPIGRTPLTVRGTLDPVGPAALFGGAVALVDSPTAQRLFAREGRFDQIDIMLAPGVDPARVREEVRRFTEGTGTLESPEDRGAALGGMLSALQEALTIVSLNAVIVGVFIIYHTMRTAILNRRRELALVRAVGYRQRVVTIATVLEVLVFGALGSMVGIVLGTAAARLSLGMVAASVGAIWARVDPGRLVMTPLDVAGALGLGVGSTLAAAVPPLIATARLRIIDCLRATDSGDTPHRARARDAIIGTIIALIAYGLAYTGLRPRGFTSQVTFIMTGLGLLTAGYVLAIPFVTELVTQPLARLARGIRGVSATLATENVARDTTRLRGTIAALMVAFALVLLVNGFVRSLRTSILTWFEDTLTSDLLVTPTLQLDLPSGPTIAGALEDRLRRVPGVAEVSPSRMITIRFGDGLAVVRTESAGGFRRQHYQVIAGDVSSYGDRFAHGDAVLVSDNFAYRHGVTAGDTLVLDTPTGTATLPIAAVVLDYTLDIGTIIVERETYRRLWRDDAATGFRVWLAPRTDPRAVRQAIADAARPEFTIVVLTAAEFMRNIARALDDALRMTYAIHAVAIAIAVIGVINFFLAEVVDRRREIGLLRSVVLTRGQVLRVFAVEAGLLGALGGFMAVLEAWPAAHAVITRSIRVVSGLGLTFVFPYGVGLAVVLLTTVVSVVAALYPARQAAAARIADLVTVE